MFSVIDPESSVNPPPCRFSRTVEPAASGGAPLSGAGVKMRTATPPSIVFSTLTP